MARVAAALVVLAVLLLACPGAQAWWIPPRSHAVRAMTAPILSADSGGCSVVDFGAKGDNRTEDTAAVQKAVNDSRCHEIVFPSPGNYLLRSVSLRSGLTVTIAEGATVVAWPDIRTWDNSTSCIFCTGDDTVSDLTIRGPGTIDGQGWRWWPYGKTISRPFLIKLRDVQNTIVTNLFLKDSPAFHMELRGVNISITHIRIEANMDACEGYKSAPNTDGINIGGRHIYVADSWVHNGDDCVPTNTFSTKSRGHLDSYDILVENMHCECGTNSGVPIVAAGSTSVRNVVYRNFTSLKQSAGIGSKISEAYENVTGTFANITWEDFHIASPRASGIYIDVYEEDTVCEQPSEHKPDNWLTAHNLTYRNIVGTDIPQAGCFLCSRGNPCTGLQLFNVTLQSRTGFKCINAQVSGDDVSPATCSS